MARATSFAESVMDQNEGLAAALAGRYEIEREIGHGGMAVVYLAHDVKHARSVALKVLRPELAASLGPERFLHEIAITASFVHPNILALYDSDEASGFLYYVMPYVNGPTLGQRLKREVQLPIDDALAITRQIAAALDYAHARGVIHRDIKPDNILLLGDHVLVADFGLARAISSAASTPLTYPRVVVGTVPYMSPEQCTPGRAVDARSDIYSLGCVVFEMITGVPPFRGATADATMTHHLTSDPPSLRTERRSCPSILDDVVRRALAKAPADRFRTAGEFVRALESPRPIPVPPPVPPRRSSTRRLAFGVAAALAAVAATGAWYATTARLATLDQNRIVVFPLHDPAGLNAVEGEGVATYIGWALDGTRPLKWHDGLELLNASQRAQGLRVQSNEAQRLSKRAGAAFYIDGSILRRLDSVTVILKLHSVAGDSVVRTTGRSARASTASPEQLGVDAVGALLPDLVAPGGKIDLAGLRERRTQAIANFVQGEREYRRMQFRAALPHYQAALREDSAFTLAALRGAYTANWLSDFGTAATLAELALRRRETLPPAQSLLARGLFAYLTGGADSALFYARSALRSDSTVHAGWTLLGEASSRLLPSDWTADSIARDALERARRTDPDFAPTLLLLWEMALRSGDVRQALVLSSELRAAGADTTHAASRELMLRCVREGPASIDWPAAARRDQNAVLASGRTLTARASQPECAIASFRALLETTGVGLNNRYAALWGLLSVLAATNRWSQAADVFTWKGVADLPRRIVYLLVASEGLGFERAAAAASDSAAKSYATAKLPAPTFWALGVWEATRGDATRVRQIARELQRKADSSRTRQDRLLHSAIAARLPLLDGDTATAIQRLRALKPSATRAGIAWEPWESLGPERMLLANLLYTRGDYEEARRVASWFDATEPVIYPLYLRSSLELRARSAEALKNAKLAAEYRRRLNELSPAND